MSQEYFPGKGKSSANDHPTSNSASSSRPQYVTVGTGSASESAARLQAMLDIDSGYGGSIAEGYDGSDSGNGSRAWNPTMTEDRPGPAHTPTVRGQTSDAADHERRIQAGAIHQMRYNQHRTALGRAINGVIEILKTLQQENAEWPAHYPSVQRAEISSPTRQDPRPGLSKTLTTLNEIPESSRPGAMRRAATSMGEGSSSAAESSQVAEQRKAPEPRLITPQIAQEFSILKLDLKLGSLHQTELVHSLEKGSIASLLDGKIRSSIKHLLALRERIEDTSSKVLVTGDLNAGKSTFCNALLRRKILPEDQQPCTSIFCEVLDARENGGLEEVHAVRKSVIYDKRDESTYEVFQIKDLENIVTDSDRYAQCKIYVTDVRAIDESLLNNGIVDISIIDAPGLNADTTKTTAVFAKQEEIDVVVFVVSAANHFTITAQEFIWAAAAEKAYLFMVVNGYDNIRDKERCQNMILKQIQNLSPRTFKDSHELVHFVSSNAVPTAPNPGGPGGGSGSSCESGGGGDGPDFDNGDSGNDKGKGKEKEKERIRDFDMMEQSLRRFVLEKRARSKLAPAKTYLLNVLGDVNTLATVNRDVAESELNRVNKELQELEPVLEASRTAKTVVSDGIDKTINDTCKEVYDYSRTTLTKSIDMAAEEEFDIPYPGLLGSFQYADDIKEAMLSQISSAVITCEQYARERSISGVSSITQLGVRHLGAAYRGLNFNSDVMFRRKRDVLARQVDIETDFWDFFDLSTLMQRQEKLAGTGMAMTVVTVVGGRLVGGWGWVDGALGAVKVVGTDNLRRLFFPGIIAAALAAGTYIVLQIPHSLPHRLSAKISQQLQTIDYVHSNSTRISSEVRKVLHHPANELRVDLQRSLEHLGIKREETLKVRIESETARKYFGNLVRDSEKLSTTVNHIDLEGPAPGVAAAFDS